MTCGVIRGDDSTGRRANSEHEVMSLVQEQAKSLEGHDRSKKLAYSLQPFKKKTALITARNLLLPTILIILCKVSKQIGKLRNMAEN